MSIKFVMSSVIEPISFLLFLYWSTQFEMNFPSRIVYTFLLSGIFYCDLSNEGLINKMPSKIVFNVKTIESGLLMLDANLESDICFELFLFSRFASAFIWIYPKLNMVWPMRHLLFQMIKDKVTTTPTHNKKDIISRKREIYLD